MAKSAKCTCSLHANSLFLKSANVQDLKMEYAESRAKEFDLEALEIDELLASKDLDIILNLTPPAVHAQLNLRASRSDKHVYCEKPFAVDLKDLHMEVAKYAKDSGLYAISAPDSFLCAAQQKARQLIDQGVISKIFRRKCSSDVYSWVFL